MGELLKAYFVPNGSYLMQEDEDGTPDPSVDALRAIGKEIQNDLRADVMIVVSPHWQTKSGFFVDAGRHHTSFTDYPLLPAKFGRRPFSYEAEGDPDLALAIVQSAKSMGLNAGTKTYGLDHGAFCPVKVMRVNCKIVPLTITQRPFKECAIWGRAIREAVEKSSRRAVLVAPGNLTHRLDLRHDNEAEAYLDKGKQFDELVIDLVTAGKFDELERIDPALLKTAAPEAGLRPLILIQGATGGQPGRLLCYHGMKYSVGDATFDFAVQAQ
jgi:aromatic ring-opening dioxygenase catalytic subunit (LigB family)